MKDEGLAGFAQIHDGLCAGSQGSGLDGGAIRIGFITAIVAAARLEGRIEARKGLALGDGDEIVWPVEEGDAVDRGGAARAFEFGLVIAGQEAISL